MTEGSHHYQQHQHQYDHQHQQPHAYSKNIKDYELGKQIGKGSFGEVFVAKTRDGERVAIKSISKKLARKKKIEERVRSEGLLHSQLHHSSILKLLVYFDDENYDYFVMELCENGDLRRYTRNHVLNELQIRKIFKQLAEGLHYLHRRRVIHRDIKPSNLLLNANMDLKIADFGLSKQLHEFNDPCHTVCGTPNYISPEILSKKPYGMESDLWSLGVVLFSLLAGKFPVDNQEFLKQIDSNWRCAVPEHVSPHGRDLILQLLHHDPARRLPLAGVLAHPFVSYGEPTPLHSTPTRHSSSHRQPLPTLHYTSPPHYPTTPTSYPPHEVYYPPSSTSSLPLEGLRISDTPPQHHVSPSPSAYPPMPLLSNYATYQSPSHTHNGVDERQAPSTPIQYLPSATPLYIPPTMPQSTTPHSSTPASPPSIPVSTTSPASQTSSPSVQTTKLDRLSTKRLKPFTLETKWGSIAISESGFVVMSLSDKNKSSVCISSDGKMLRTFAGKGQHSEHQLASLPAKFVGYYRFAFQFIEVVRSRTPKVIYRTDMCTASLMESMKHFEASFPDNFKVHYTKEAHQWRFSLDSPNSSTQSSSSGSSTNSGTAGTVGTGGYVTATVGESAQPGSPLVTIDESKMEVYVEHAKMCLKKCLEFEAIESKGQENFPLDISHKIRRTVTAPPKPSPTSSISGNSSVGSNPTSASIYLSTSSSVSSGSSSTSRGPMFKTAFLPGVGWGLRAAATTDPADMWIQFHDGTQMVISPDCSVVEFTDGKGLTTRHEIGHEMPPLVKEKFTHATSFYDLMKSQRAS